MNADVQEQLRRLWESSRPTVLARIAGMRRLVEDSEAGDIESDRFATAREDAHKLAGSLGMFGLKAASVLAKEIEGLLAEASSVTPSLADRVARLAAMIDDAEAPPTSTTNTPDATTKSVVLLISQPGSHLTMRLEDEAKSTEIALVAVSAVVQLDTSLREWNPRVALIDMDGLADLEALFGKLSLESIPFYGLSRDLGTESRLAVTRAGGAALLDCKLAFPDLLSRIKVHLEEKPPCTVLLVDDDPLMVEAVNAVLSSTAFRLESLANPMQLMEELERVQPDAILLDVDMPEASGIELCGILRSEPRWQSVPILVLTAHDDLNTVHEALRAGADDFIAKQAITDELAVRLLDRLEQAAPSSRPRMPSESGSEEYSYDFDIAVVEDDEVMAEILVTTLTSNGYSVEHCADGQKALDRLTGEDRVRVRMALLDVNLPGQDGLAVLRAMGREGVLEETKVIMVTARSSEPEVLQALREGASDHIAKPFSVPLLLERVRRALAD